MDLAAWARGLVRAILLAQRGVEETSGEESVALACHGFAMVIYIGATRPTDPRSMARPVQSSIRRSGTLLDVRID